MNGRITWEARRLMREVGWPGIAGVGLMLCVIVFRVEGMLPLREQVTQLQRDADVLRAKLAARRTSSQAVNPANQLSQFYEFFPDGNAMADTLERLQATAAAENLTLEQGKYRLASETIGQLARYDIVLPVKGAYPRVRRFIARALRENPSLALEGVSFGRQAAITIGVDAQVRMILYLKDVQ
ncbi:MAG: hypothetical protein PHY45_06520 [Rhodocyclaceae bacterium]|nr:hypothetical protein [Rhodocyclaceae bacterium]